LILSAPAPSEQRLGTNRKEVGKALGAGNEHLLEDQHQDLAVDSKYQQKIAKTRLKRENTPSSP
jgi:hypothetical protein